MDEEVLGLERRRKVYQLIRSHPGLHMRELERRLPISLGDLRYHLDYLEREGLISSKSDGFRKAYFSVRGFSVLDRDLLALLRQRSPRRIILHLLAHGEAASEDLQQAVALSRSTISFHLRKLTDAGLVRVRREEGRHYYRLVDEDRTAHVLITYRESFLDAAVDRVLDAWLR